jgi:hypothetical protein
MQLQKRLRKLASKVLNRNTVTQFKGTSQKSASAFFYFKRELFNAAAVNVVVPQITEGNISILW